MQGFVLSPGTLVRKVGLSMEVITPGLPLSQPLQPFFLSGVAPGLSLVLHPGEWTISDRDGAALTAAPPCHRPSWGPWLHGLR